MTEPLIYDLSSPGRMGVTLPEVDVPLAALPAGLTRENLPLPEVSEIDVIRHFVKLSQLNHGIDSGFYPLGSCTMKYNPKINEDVARLSGFAHTHPLQDPTTVQGNLALMYSLQEWLKEIGGFAGVSLQPAAGAHGELTGILILRAYHRARGQTGRTKILIPDSAHGTNPASTAMAGMEVVELASDARGNVDLESLRAACDDTVAGLMLTNPNTLGLFEEHVLEVVEQVRRSGLRRRRQHERAPRRRAAGRPGLRRAPLQSAQDVLDTARRRRARLGTGGRGRSLGGFPARPDRRYRG
jgi:glycine dehydrogenase subunit 2